jgi:redox-sensitive bicupin YhaK (pirin superfamily)
MMRVSQGMGFGKHPHDNINFIPLEGDLEHQDGILP